MVYLGAFRISASLPPSRFISGALLFPPYSSSMALNPAPAALGQPLDSFRFQFFLLDIAAFQIVETVPFRYPSGVRIKFLCCRYLLSPLAPGGSYGFPFPTALPSYSKRFHLGELSVTHHVLLIAGFVPLSILSVLTEIDPLIWRCYSTQTACPPRTGCRTVAVAERPHS